MAWGTAGRRDIRLLLAGAALLAGGLAFLADSCSWRPLPTGPARGIPALLAGLGLLGAARLYRGMRWAIGPSIFFLLYAVSQLFRPLPLPAGAGSTLALAAVGFAFLLLLLLRPGSGRLWPLLPAGAFLFLAAGTALARAGWAGEAAVPFSFFLGLGLAAIAHHFLSRKPLWPLLLGLLALLAGLLVLVERSYPDQEAGGIVLLIGLGASFLLLHLRRRETWWPVIPGGILTAQGLSLAAGRAAPLEDDALAALFLLGLAATFGYLFLYGARRGRLAWARFPAIGLASLALLILLVGEGGSSRVTLLLALAMLGLGLFLLLRAWRARRGD
jgi:hypothetical protein